MLKHFHCDMFWDEKPSNGLPESPNEASPAPIASLYKFFRFALAESQFAGYGMNFSFIRRNIFVYIIGLSF